MGMVSSTFLDVRGRFRFGCLDRGLRCRSRRHSVPDNRPSLLAADPPFKALSEVSELWGIRHANQLSKVKESRADNA
jgi:hypothetical protein